jgi:hypothetical protein
MISKQEILQQPFLSILYVQSHKGKYRMEKNGSSPRIYHSFIFYFLPQ